MDSLDSLEDVDAAIVWAIANDRYKLSRVFGGLKERLNFNQRNS